MGNEDEDISQSFATKIPRNATKISQILAALATVIGNLPSPLPTEEKEEKKSKELKECDCEELTTTMKSILGEVQAVRALKEQGIVESKKQEVAGTFNTLRSCVCGKNSAPNATLQEQKQGQDGPIASDEAVLQELVDKGTLSDNMVKEGDISQTSTSAEPTYGAGNLESTSLSLAPRIPWNTSKIITIIASLAKVINNLPSPLPEDKEEEKENEEDKVKECDCAELQKTMKSILTEVQEVRALKEQEIVLSKKEMEVVCGKTSVPKATLQVPKQVQDDVVASSEPVLQVSIDKGKGIVTEDEPKKGD